jgi:hypothetical protein
MTEHQTLHFLYIYILTLLTYNKIFHSALFKGWEAHICNVVFWLKRVIMFLNSHFCGRVFNDVSVLSAVDIRDKWDLLFFEVPFVSISPFIISHEQDGISSGHYLIVCNHDTVYSLTKQLVFCTKMSWQGSSYAELTKLCVVVDSTGYFSLYKCDFLLRNH